MAERIRLAHGNQPQDNQPTNLKLHLTVVHCHVNLLLYTVVIQFTTMFTETKSQEQ